MKYSYYDVKLSKTAAFPGGPIAGAVSAASTVSSGISGVGLTVLMASILGLGGLGGYVSAKLTAPGALDESNVKKEYQDARLSSDIINMVAKLKNERRMSQSSSVSAKPARVLGL